MSSGNGLREALAAAAGEEVRKLDRAGYYLTNSHQPPARLMHSQFFANPTTSSRSLSHSYTQTHQSASSTSHPSIANTRLLGLITDIRAKLLERSPPKPPIDVPNPFISAADEEERKRVERDQEKSRRDLEDRVKDLEVEVTCAKAREDEARRLVEEFARIQAQAGWVPLIPLRSY